MARPTARHVALAEQLERSPSTIAGWEARGLGVAPGSERLSPVEHLRLVAELIGTGRPDDVAMVKMAALHRSPCRGLRAVLGEGLDVPELPSDPNDRDRWWSRFEATPPASWQRARETTRGLAVAAIDELYHDGAVPAAQDALADVAMTSAQHAFMEGVLGVEPDELGQADLGTLLPVGLTPNALRRLGATLRRMPAWVESASADALADAVGLARELVGARAPSSGEEAYWREVAAAAPLAGLLRQDFSQLGDEAGALLDRLSPALGLAMAKWSPIRRWLFTAVSLTTFGSDAQDMVLGMMRASGSMSRSERRRVSRAISSARHKADRHPEAWEHAFGLDRPAPSLALPPTTPEAPSDPHP